MLVPKDTMIIKQNRVEGILDFGADKRNDYPNVSRTISDNSGALGRCQKIYRNFLFGQGMAESGDFWKVVINPFGLRVDQLLRRIGVEMSIHDGVALQIGYNANLDPISITPYPFETIRVENNQDVYGNAEYKYITTVKYHEDWTASRFKKDKIKTFNVYNRDKEVIARQIDLAGGIENWNGQMFYYGKDGLVAYPHNKFHEVMEDAITDIYIKKGKNASASTNFMPSHIIQMPDSFAAMSNMDDDKDGKKLEKSMTDSLKMFQGYDQAAKLWIIQNKCKDENGKMVPFKIDKLELQNYDKVFELTEKSCKENTRDCYLIPEVLFVLGKGFSTDEIVNGFNYYNNIIKHDQQILEEIFMELFTGWAYDINPSKNYAITPLQYMTDKEPVTPEKPTE